MSTVQEALNIANPNSLPDMVRKVTLGDIVAGLIPRLEARTGLVSSATQVEPEPGPILSVSIATGAVLLILMDGVAAAGEVLVTYDADGVATLVFGDGAQTAYKVLKMVMPAGLDAVLTADSGTCV